MSADVGVVVPFHNVEPYLADCLRSIAEQTWTDLDVVLVDDGSTDGSAQIADEWARRDPRFRVLHEPHHGVAVARNIGIEAVGGRYLMFVDSDDLVTPRAVEQLRTSLEASGSDFAAAHVWRLPLDSPPETSWAHRDLFAERRIGTTIREFPLLVRDRMVWNKLWRRSFWDEHRLSFPDMWFEDFPVMLRAHLAARAVDLLPDPVYVWRERPSGDSISQRGVDVGNVRDRVVAAEMVLALVDAGADRELRELVHSQLCDVDLREILQSLPRVAPADVAAVRELAVRLAAALDGGLLGLARAPMRHAYAAVQRGDFATASSWAGFLVDRSYVRLARAVGANAAARREFAADLAVTARTRPGGLARRTRSARLQSMSADTNRLELRCFVPLQGSLGRYASADVIAGRIAARVRSRRRPGGLEVVASFDSADLSVLRVPLPVIVKVRVGPLTWEGGVRPEAVGSVATRRGGIRIQTTVVEGALCLEGLAHAPTITEVRFGDQTVTLRLASAGDGDVVVPRSWPAPPRTAVQQGGEVTFALADLLADDPADDPVSRVASQPITVEIAGSSAEPLLMDAVDASTEVAGQQLAVVRGADGRAYLRHHLLDGSAQAPRIDRSVPITRS